jgi:aryl carrier-like protein
MIAPALPLGESIKMARLRQLAAQLRQHGASLDLNALNADLTWSALCSLFESAWHSLA